MQTVKTLESVTKLTVDKEALGMETEPELRLEAPPAAETETETNHGEGAGEERKKEERQPLEWFMPGTRSAVFGDSNCQLQRLFAFGLTIAALGSLLLA